MIRQLPLPFVHAPQYDAQPFLQAPSNEAALAWLGRAAEWPQQRLAVWGGDGCGKTHLLHHWARRACAMVLDGAALVVEPPSGPVAIDDADTAPERALLHMLNAAAEQGFPVLVVGRAAPARWAVGLPDLASRLRAMLAVEIRAPEESLLRALLARLLADRQLAVPEPVQEHLLRLLPRTPAAIREAVARLDRLALAAGGRITKSLAVEIAMALQDDELRDFREDLIRPAVAASPDLPGLL